MSSNLKPFVAAEEERTQRARRRGAASMGCGQSKDGSAPTSLPAEQAGERVASGAIAVQAEPQPISSSSDGAPAPATLDTAVDAASPAAEVPPIPNAPRRRLLVHAEVATLAVPGCGAEDLFNSFVSRALLKALCNPASLACACAQSERGAEMVPLARVGRHCRAPWMPGRRQRRNLLLRTPS